MLHFSSYGAINRRICDRRLYNTKVYLLILIGGQPHFLSWRALNRRICDRRLHSNKIQLSFFSNSGALNRRICDRRLHNSKRVDHHNYIVWVIRSCYDRPGGDVLNILHHHHVPLCSRGVTNTRLSVWRHTACMVRSASCHHHGVSHLTPWCSTNHTVGTRPWPPSRCGHSTHPCVA